jgi:hypothetical protein
MHARIRLTRFVAFAAIAALTIACGGQPVEPPPAEEPVEAPAPVQPEVTPIPEPEIPAVPQLQGNIVGVDDTWEWLSAPTRENPARYKWTVSLRNDTTQTLDITVRFDMVDADERIIKTDRRTVRVAPADTATAQFEGEMPFDVARSFDSYTYTWDWEIVEHDR